jgi:hypothetical protein
MPNYGDQRRGVIPENSSDQDAQESDDLTAEDDEEDPDENLLEGEPVDALISSAARRRINQAVLKPQGSGSRQSACVLSQNLPLAHSRKTVQGRNANGDGARIFTFLSLGCARLFPGNPAAKPLSSTCK